MARIKAGRVSGEHMQPKDPIITYFILTKRNEKSSLFENTTPVEGYVRKEGKEC
jgi:hypothetical protein